MTLSRSPKIMGMRRGICAGFINEHDCFTGKSEEHCPLWSSRHGWEDYINTYSNDLGLEDVECIHQALVSRVMKPSVLQMPGIS
jgi:hypothetical protein